MLSSRSRRVAVAAVLSCAAVAVAATSTGPTSAGGGLAVRDGCTSGNCSDPTNSFTPDTLVVMADGSARRIADVTAGDRVAATDPVTGSGTAQPVVKVITGTGAKVLVEVTTDAGTVTATANHRFWVADRGGWRTADGLAVGDLLGDGSGGQVRVLGLRTVTRPATVHNLDVTGVQTFQVLVGGHRVLTHE
jgi:hypothetical protein